METISRTEHCPHQGAGDSLVFDSCSTISEEPIQFLLKGSSLEDLPNTAAQHSGRLPLYSHDIWASRSVPRRCLGSTVPSNFLECPLIPHQMPGVHYAQQLSRVPSAPTPSPAFLQLQRSHLSGLSSLVSSCSGPGPLYGPLEHCAYTVLFLSDTTTDNSFTA